MTRQTPTVDDDIPLALRGDPEALERVLLAAQPLVFNLAMRMLGRREDALDITQEVLLRVATHLSAYRRESLFSTWVYRIAVNALMDEKRAATRRGRERSFTELAHDIEGGIDRLEAAGDAVDPVTPEHRLEAVELALVCTQGMLSALQGSLRLAYVLGEVMQFDGEEAARIAGVSPVAYRQQLARARQALRDFVEGHCGLVSSRARCTCDRQLRSLDERQVAWLGHRPLSDGCAAPVLQDAVAQAGLRDIRRLQSAAQLFRAHPDYQVDGSMVHQVRERIEGTVFGSADRARPLTH